MLVLSNQEECVCSMLVFDLNRKWYAIKTIYMKVLVWFLVKICRSTSKEVKFEIK